MNHISIVRSNANRIAPHFLYIRILFQRAISGT